MIRVQIWAEVVDSHFRAYEREARRRGVPVERLVEQTVNCLLRELEHEEIGECVEERPASVP